MFKKLVKKLVIAATLVGMATTVAASVSACRMESDHPEVKITVEFNNETYDLEYTLYRNMYPHTVRHFIELADSGYYNDMIVHNYQTSDWFSGAYSYDEEDYATAKSINAYADYLGDHSKEQEYIDLFKDGKLSPSVYRYSPLADNQGDSENVGEVLPTLLGEFYNNIKQEIEKGALSAEQGTLKMYYYEKDTTEKISVFPTSDQNITADYKYNCATSVFMMQVSGSQTYPASSYCVFGKMSSTNALTDLLDAVSEYYEDNSASSITVSDVKVDELLNEYLDAGDHEENFRLPAIPIIIRSVSVTKY